MYIQLGAAAPANVCFAGGEVAQSTAASTPTSVLSAPLANWVKGLEKSRVKPLHRTTPDQLMARINACHTRWDTYYCESCGELGVVVEKRILRSCFVRYCKTCFTQRKMKALKRLNGYGIRSKRLFHLVLGYPRGGTLTKEKKKRFERFATLFAIGARGLGYTFTGLKVYDVNQEEGGIFIHFHYALLPEGKEYDARELIQLAREVSGGEIKAVRLIGFRPKRKLFDYFAKRCAGGYGHGDQTVFMADMLTVEEYIDFAYGSRAIEEVGSIPEGLSCNIVPISTPICPKCGSPMTWVCSGSEIEASFGVGDRG